MDERRTCRQRLYYIDNGGIATRSGKMYQGVKLQTVSSSEIIISYSDDEGVMQLENIKLADLPDDLQKHFGY